MSDTNTNLNMDEFNKNIQDAANKASETVKTDLGAKIDANKTASDNANTTIQEAVDKLSTKLDSIHVMTEKAKNVTLTDILAKSENVEGFAALKNREISSFEVKLEPNSDIMKSVSYSGTGESLRVPNEARDLEIQTNPHYQTSIAANLINVATSNNDIVRYTRESTQTNAAAGKAHGAAFAEKNVPLQNYSENIVTIGEFITFNEEQMTDVAGLRSFITTEFMGDLADIVDKYILEGTGSANNQLHGFDQTGQHTAWVSSGTVTGANNVDVLIDAISQLEQANYRAKTIFMNPLDFWGAFLIQAKSSQNEYVARQILTAAQTGVMPMIGGANIVRSNAVTSDKFFVVDTAKAAKLWTGEGTSIEFARNGDDFKNNQISGRIKCRKALTVGRPSGIIYGDFSDARTAKTA